VLVELRLMVEVHLLVDLLLEEEGPAQSVGQVLLVVEVAPLMG
jgi:hypothetical protein